MEPLKIWVVQILDRNNNYFDEMGFVGYSRDIPAMRVRVQERWAHKWDTDCLSIGAISGTQLDRDFSK